ncbi:MAG: FAD-dependent oxidoreductase [Pirellulaceae bacterium]
MNEPQYDVIVVGAGGSGLAAACSAARLGGRVLVLEKQPQPGGTTGIAVGSFTTSGTDFQRAAGIDDNPRDHAEDAGKFAAPEIEAENNAALRDWFLTQSAETLAWLQSLGVSFVGPSPEPPNRVPRMHNVVPGAKAYIAALQLDLLRHGGELLCDAAVTSLQRDGGRVVGVTALVAGQEVTLRARRGVILAAGDYANNPDIISRYLGEQFRSIEGINPFAGGDGHQLAEAVGAELVNMQIAYGPELRFVPSNRRPFQQWLPAGGLAARLMGAVARRLPAWVMRKMIKRLLVTWQHPEVALFDDGAVLLNARGERFVDEAKWPAREIGVARQPEKVAYILLDGRLIERYSAWPHFLSTAPDIAYAYVRDYERLRPDVTHRGRDLAEVARSAGLPVEAVARSVTEFNAYVAGEAGDPHGRTGDVQGLKDSPWVLLGPLKAYFTTTEGGAAVNQRLEVLDGAGNVIPGLYAVGQNGLGGMVLWGHGLHIAWAITSGRLAGQSVMRDG